MLKTIDRTPSSASYAHNAIWRVHFWAGIFVAPFLLTLAVTGGIYLFDREIEAVWYRQQIHLTPIGARAPLDAQERAILSAFPDAIIRAYEEPRAADQAAKWTIFADGETRLVFLDPYQLRVTGDIAARNRLMAVVSSLHGTLLNGDIGSLVVECVACWTIVLALSGIYLWAPRGARRLAGVLYPRLERHGGALWRDLHAVPAAFVSLMVLFLVLTGLPWSAFWGERLSALGALSTTTFPTPNFGAPPPKRLASDDAASAGAGELPWAVRRSPAPVSAGGGARRFGVGDVETRLNALGVEGPRLRIFYPRDVTGVFTVSLVPDKAENQRTLYFDPAFGRVLDDIGFADYSPLGKAVEWGVMTHMGRQYGPANQGIMLLTCLTLAFAIPAGLVTAWKRRRFAPPPRGDDERLPNWARATLLGLGVCFPLLGVTLAIAASVDWIARRRAAM